MSLDLAMNVTTDILKPEKMVSQEHPRFITIVLPDKPISVNMLLKMHSSHWSKTANYFKKIKRHAYDEFDKLWRGAPPIKDRALISVYPLVESGRLPDTDNVGLMIKPVIDAAQGAGILVVDTPKYVHQLGLYASRHMTPKERMLLPPQCVIVHIQELFKLPSEG